MPPSEGRCRLASKSLIFPWARSDRQGPWLLLQTTTTPATCLSRCPSSAATDSKARHNDITKLRSGGYNSTVIFRDPSTRLNCPYGLRFWRRRSRACAWRPTASYAPRLAPHMGIDFPLVSRRSALFVWVRLGSLFRAFSFVFNNFSGSSSGKSAGGVLSPAIRLARKTVGL